MSDKKKLVIYHESLVQSIVADCFTFGCLVGSVLVGKWIDSNALQWIAGMLLILFITTAPFKSKTTCYSPEEAKEAIDRIAAKWARKDAKAKLTP